MVTDRFQLGGGRIPWGQRFLLKLIMTFNTINPQKVALLVCHCHRVCDRVIRECVDGGARSLDDIGRACGAGTACGGCQPTIGALLAGEPADAGVISLGKGRAQRMSAVASADSAANSDSDSDAIASDARFAYGNL